jgi:carboxyvinyl-carboxyphosphonate phosphorylmutase
LLSGSVAAASLHGFPDLVLVTMTEVAQLAKRITDYTALSLQVDCDNGFGNALNVMRCVREFEAAGAASLTLEDTDLPRPYDSKGPSAIPINEMCGKLEAAVAARKDSEIVIVGRTDTFRISGINEAIERVRAYQETGVDAIFVPGLQRREDLEKIRKNISLPAISSGLPESEGSKSGLEILKEIGFCMTVLAKYPFMIVVKALYDSLSHLKENGEPGPFEEKMASTRMLEQIIRADQYGDYQKRFMSAAKNSSIQNKQ